MKIITKAIYQMTPTGYELLSEESYDYHGLIAEAKGGGGGGSTIDPATMGMLTKQSADLNRTNTAGTYGSSEWSIDPVTGRYTQNVKLNPSQQNQLDSRNQIAEGMLGHARKNFGEMSGPFGYSDGVSGPARASFDGAVARFKPQFEQQTRNFDQQMANQGLPMGGEAYNKAEQSVAQNQNDAVNQAAQQSVGTQNSMDTSQRQQRFSDIANMLGTQNEQKPTAGTQASIDTTGNFNTLNSGVSALQNQATAARNSGSSNLMALLGAFI